MAKKFMKKCSPSLAIKEMKIKATLRFYHIPVRMSHIKNITNDKFCKDVGKQEPSYTAVGNAN
jgi:hypothetical protein